MATLVLNPETLTTPEESISTAPVTCAACGAQWDRDEQPDMFERIDGKSFCSDALGAYSCADKARVLAFRREAAAVTRTAIVKLQEQLADIAEEYPTDIDDPGHPAMMVADVLARLDLFEKGYDNGWRNGAMLEYGEAFQLRQMLRHPLGLTITSPLPGHDEVALRPQYNAAQTLHRILVKIENATKRTQEGAGR